VHRAGVALLARTVGVWLGNVSPLLLLGTAAAWRYRTRLRPLVFVAGSVIATKLFLWPLAVWLFVTSRIRAAVLSAVLVVFGILVAWAAIGFAGMTAYPHLLINVASVGEGRGSSLVAFLIAIGIPADAARVGAMACAAGLLVAALKLSRLSDGDERSFGLVLVAALTATPIVWAHYLLLLYVPIALLSPRFSRIWFIPMLAILAPIPATHPEVWTSVPDLAIEAVIVGWLCQPLLDRRAPSAAPSAVELRPS